MGLVQCFLGVLRFLLVGVEGVSLLLVGVGRVFSLVLGCSFIGEMLGRRGDGFWQCDNTTLGTCPGPNHRWLSAHEQLRTWPAHYPA